MEGKHVDGIVSLKAVVEEKKNKVIFVESDYEFVDVLFSFLTMPLGTIIRLAREHSIPLKMGCMNKLYESVKNIDLRHFHFHSEAGKLMFLSPRSGAESSCVNLRLKIDNTECKRFRCSVDWCGYSGLYRDVFCRCGRPMNHDVLLENGVIRKNEGVFVDGMTRFIISDGLRVAHLSCSEGLSLLAKHGITDMSNAHERSFNVGAEEVLNLLIRSLQSRTALTEVLLKNKGLPDMTSSGPYRVALTESIKKEEKLQDQDGQISVKLMICKSKKMVCYAVAKKDFVNLLLSFLTVPLGHIARQLCEGADSTIGCIDQLYESVKSLDEKLFKSNSHKEMLVCPSPAYGFSYKNDLLGMKSASTRCNNTWAIMDPKSHSTIEGKTDEGILTGSSTMFIVTDSLIISPISSFLCMSILKELKVPLSDIQEHVVHVGKEEAVRLLLSSFLSESALTNAFVGDSNWKPSTC